ncbi:hypothetical protein DYST_03357 [Dyella terrae]|nr:hypothetical protein DYST_03357 [Dyella terrae]
MLAAPFHLSRHPCVGRRRFSTAEWLVIQLRQWLAVASSVTAIRPLTQRAFRSSADDAKLVPWNTAGSSERFATRPREEDLKQASLRFPTRYASRPVWRTRHGTASSFSSALALCAKAGATRPAAMRCAAQLHEPSAFAFDLPGPLCGGEGWTKRPAGGIGKDADPFSPGQEALSKSPAAPHELAGFAGQRQVGVPFLRVTFLWASKEK